MYEDIEKKPGQESNGNYYVQDNRHVDNANQTYEIEQYNDRTNQTYEIEQHINSANQTYEIERLATPDDYNNEALYEEMTARYYVCKLSSSYMLYVALNCMCSYIIHYYHK